MPPTKAKTDPSEFVNELQQKGWKLINAFNDRGNCFELLAKGKALLLVQLFPRNNGFEVWRPIAESSLISHTKQAVDLYELEVK